MRILNTRKKPDSPADEDIEELRRLMEQALGDPDGFIIIRGASIKIDADGNIILRKD